MKRIKLFEEFINERVKDTFNSHKNHNPTADILQRQLDRDTQVTYGIYIKDSGSQKKGDEFMELYIGSNYSPDSTKRSYSRLYTPDQIPAKYKSIWNELKDKYHSELKESAITEAKSIQDHVKKANEYKADLMKLKKEAKEASDPQAHAAKIEAKEEQLRRVADVIRNLRADGVKEELTEAKSKIDVGTRVAATGKTIGSFGNHILGIVTRKNHNGTYEVTFDNGDISDYRLDQLKFMESVTEAKDLRSLQRSLDKLQNDYEAVLDDEALDAMTQLITTINSKL